MTVLLIVGVVIILMFSLVVLMGAPYVPSLTKNIDYGLGLLGLQAGDLLLDLGCGDGRVLKAAAKRGNRVIGYEINPILAVIAWLRTRSLAKGQVKVVWGDAFRRTWPAEARGIFVFGVQRVVDGIDRKLVAERRHDVAMVSIGFAVSGKEADAQKGAAWLYKY